MRDAPIMFQAWPGCSPESVYKWINYIISLSSDFSSVDWYNTPPGIFPDELIIMFAAIDRFGTDFMINWICMVS